MKPLGLSQYRNAKDIGVSPIRISEIMNRQLSITANTVLRLGRYFGISAAVWLRMQVRYGLELAEKEFNDRIAHEVKFLYKAATCE